MRLHTLTLISVLSFYSSYSYAQSARQKFSYSKISSHCLNADVKAALQLMSASEMKGLTKRDSLFVLEVTKRFGSDADRSTYLSARQSPLDELLTLYRNYWRMSLLNPERSFDSLLRVDLSTYLLTRSLSSTGRVLPEDSLHLLLIEHIENKGYRTTGFGMTGKLYDLLVWKQQKDTLYRFNLHSEVITTPVVFMDAFVTLGWEEYATADRAYPGGWAKPDTLYCVRKAYKLKSEDFLIRYLCHEGRHFLDLKKYPAMESKELEYRAQLTELSLLKDDLYKTVELFIRSADKNSLNAHSAANHLVIAGLSKKLFKNDFESDLARWKAVSISKIQKMSYELLKENTRFLDKKK